MPEIQITREQSQAIGVWLKQEAAAGRVQLVSDVNFKIEIPLIDGDPIVLGRYRGEDRGAGEWVSSSDKVFTRMREAGLGLTPSEATGPVVDKWIHKEPWTSEPEVNVGSA